MYKPEGALLSLPKAASKPGLNKVAYNAIPADANYPLFLIVGNADHHRGVDSERNYSLMKFTSEPYVGLNESDAKSLMIANGDLVKVESHTGKLVGKAMLMDALQSGTIFLPENFGELRPNVLMGLKEKFDHVKVTKM